MSIQSLIIDCDPGVDDAVALFLAFAAPELELLAVTTVGGNVPGAKTQRNARIIRQIAGREEVPVFGGAERPLKRPPAGAGEFHGVEGLGDLEPFEPTGIVGDGPAANAIVDLVMSRPEGSVAIAVLGPMTNLALAMRRERRLAERLGPVVVMGGARSEGGNVTASAEFNIWDDPDAAQKITSALSRANAEKDRVENMDAAIDDLEVLVEMAEEESDAETRAEAEKEAESIVAGAREEAARAEVTASVLIPASQSIAAGQNPNAVERNRIEIPGPSAALSEALKTRSPAEIAADPGLAREVRQIDQSLIQRFGHEGSALLMKGHEAEARSLLPPGQNLEQIREVLRPLLKAVVADDQLQTALAQQQTLGREGPQVGRGM